MKLTDHFAGRAEAIPYFVFAIIAFGISLVGLEILSNRWNLGCTPFAVACILRRTLGLGE